MKQYSLEIYKIQTVEVILQSYKLHKTDTVIMTFTDSSQLKKNDLIWAEDDMARNDTSQMLVVKAVFPSGNVKLKRPDGEGIVQGLRHFKKEEKFKVVASFKAVEDGEPKKYTDSNS